jgi:hypothetical protein
MLLTKYDGRMLPVTRVIGTDPVVKSEETEKRIGDNTPFFAERAPYFASTTIEVRRMSAGGIAMKMVMSEGDDPRTSGGLMGGTSFIEIVLSPSTELRGAFIALVVGALSAEGDETKPPHVQIIIHDLPNLPEGKETLVTFSAPLAGNTGGDTRYFPLIFANGGAEVRSNLWKQSARHFTLLERRKQSLAMTDYCTRFRDSDHAATPFVLVQPLLPAGMEPPSSPVVATLEISAAGRVISARLEPNGPTPFNQTLADTVADWLFLPRLKAGQPVSSRVQIPLKF